MTENNSNPTSQPTQPVQTPTQNVTQAAQGAVNEVKDVANQAAQQGVQAATNLAGNAANVAKDAANAAVQQGVKQIAQVDVAKLFKVKEGQPPVTSNEKLFGAVCYIPLVAILVLLVAGSSDYVKLHGRQGLILFALFFVSVFLLIIPYIGGMFFGLLQMILFVVGIFSAYQAFIGNWFKIPVFGDLAMLIPVNLFVSIVNPAANANSADANNAQPQK